MPNNLHVANSQQGLTVKAYRGDGSCLIAFNLDDHLVADLAGFAIQRTSPDGKSEVLLNRLSFKSKYTSATTATERKWTPTTKAPFQKFWWVDFPPSNRAGEYRYQVTAMRFGTVTKLIADQQSEVALQLGKFHSGQLGQSNCRLRPRTSDGLCHRSNTSRGPLQFSSRPEQSNQG